LKSADLLQLAGLLQIEGRLQLGTACGAVQVRIRRVTGSLRCKTDLKSNNLKPTHFCCDNVKEIGV
jgi:hypothetical protein